MLKPGKQRLMPMGKMPSRAETSMGQPLKMGPLQINLSENLRGTKQKPVVTGMKKQEKPNSI